MYAVAERAAEIIVGGLERKGACIMRCLGQIDLGLWCL